ncbi:aminoglycoside phosphotransferase family protein [Streptomyces sp. SID13666]|uniref:aminoglycoside phosphotransferase family protein n=1 Tax=unclassified Streptomyces TaxID=2593676 RepID=UPI0013C28231|nr:MULTISPECIES: aminoglycoside phosphotransferase family protein [unclassified Streptomyces]NEA56245.1 aminoglycoside phosphotransferase family protein [Streptomyces sp. SID13666]NEA71916.1 aminoglycoside phosphotransferase family protein [Streptomyces sp. SID13588]
MTEPASLPASLAAWVESVVGPIQAVRDTAHARTNSQVWEVTSRAGRHFVKVAPSPVFYTRETRAYREAVPHLGYANAPALKDSSPELLALILTAVDGEPLKSEASPAQRLAAHEQAGRLLRGFHEALPNHAAQAEAAHAIEATVTGLEKHLAAASDHLSGTEADMLRRLVSTLPDLSPLPAGLLHGDFWERNMLWNGRCCALIDYERSTPGPLVADFVKLATAVWPEHPELSTALFAGYGRPLSALEEQALVAFAAADAASALAYGLRHGDTHVTARGRLTVERLAQEGRR